MSKNGGAALRAWMVSKDGKRTPLLTAIEEDLDALGVRIERCASAAQVERLIEEIQALKMTTVAAKSLPPGELMAPPGKIVPLAEIEKAAILNAINICAGDVPLAARALGVGQATLYRRLHEYGVEPEKIRRAARRREKLDARTHAQGHEGEVEASGEMVPALGAEELPVGGVRPAEPEGEQPPADDGSERR